jgi:hypothetical protein
LSFLPRPPQTSSRHTTRAAVASTARRSRSHHPTS